MDAFILPASQLGGTVFTVISFLWYLSKRDDKWTDSLHENGASQVLLAQALQKLTDMVERNSSVNQQNTGAVKDNTVATDNSTQETKITNGKH